MRYWHILFSVNRDDRRSERDDNIILNRHLQTTLITKHARHLKHQGVQLTLNLTIPGKLPYGKILTLDTFEEV